MRQKYLVIIMLVSICMMACTNNENKKKQDNTVQNETVEWNYDLTGDGIEEKILINPNSIGSPNESNEEMVEETGPYTIEIYSGKTKEIIWKENVSGIHAQKESINLYEKDGVNYLLKWEPAMWQGNATYGYKIFSLTEEGKEVELENNQVTFEIMDSDMNDIYKMFDFADDCMNKLSESFVLVDYISNLYYSTPDNKVKAADPHLALEGDIGEITEQIYLRYKES